MGELRIFGYGSLMYEPELPEWLIGRVPGQVRGMQRAFNKRSLARGAPASLVGRPGLDGFVEDGIHLSLCLGTEPGDGLDGMVLRYPSEVAEVLLPKLHLREGWAPDRPDRENGYHPVQVQVETAAGPVTAWAWLTNPGSRFYVRLPLEEQARVLWHATPRVMPADGRARGADYLLGVKRALDAVGVHDPYVEALTAAVERMRA